MKQQTAPLIAFIRDHGLERQDGYICFRASVHFQADGAWYKFISPVHIITISLKQLDVIYLLDPAIDEKRIKTMFTNPHRFYYGKNRRFEIHGRSKRHGKYRITIIPINKRCEESVVGELTAKRYN